MWLNQTRPKYNSLYISPKKRIIETISSYLLNFIPLFLFLFLFVGLLLAWLTLFVWLAVFKKPTITWFFLDCCPFLCVLVMWCLRKIVFILGWQRCYVYLFWWWVWINMMREKQEGKKYICFFFGERMSCLN